MWVMKDAHSENTHPLGSYEKGWSKLKKRPLAKRILLGLVFLASLGWFLHFREVKIEVLEPDTTADRYIIGQIDFEFPDEQATAVLKREAARDVKVIYKIDEKFLKQQRIEFEDHLIQDQQWRRQLEKSTFEEIYKGADALEGLLFQMRFTDPRTLQKIQELHLSTQKYWQLSLDPATQTVAFPKNFWDNIRKEAFSGQPFQMETIDFILKNFEGIPWAMEEDSTAERSVRQLIQDNMKEVLTKVLAGSHIIDAGEKVSPRHIAMLQAMKKALLNAQNLTEPLTILGSMILALMFTILGYIYLRINHRDLLNSFQKLTLLATIVILTLLLSKGMEYLLINQATALIDVVRYPLIVPFASILLSLLLGSEVALFISALLAVVLGASLAVDHTRFLVINLIASLVAILSARHMHKRKEIFAVCGKVWLCCIPVVFAFHFIENTSWNLGVTADLGSSLVFMAVTALLVVGLLPLLESVFNIMTDMTLMEYTDPNNELLRRFSLEAPGSYQHSLVVGNLAETAARSIHANGLFCRASTLYHDIGKLSNPHYFTENQLGGFNIHQLLTPQESAQVIIAHKTEGEALARKYHLPKSFIDIIQEHHGTTLVYYFYCKQVEIMKGDVSKIDQHRFRYSGPKPRTKESAIIMIADGVEAASRALDEITEESVVDMVNRIVSDKIEDGQFDECQLTFEELGRIKQAMIKTLVVARHLRIKYPSIN